MSDSPPSSDRPPKLPPGLDLEMLAECRWFESCRDTFALFDRPVALWEAICMVLQEGRTIKAEIKRLENFRKTGSQNLVDDLTKELFEELERVRGEYGDLAAKIRPFLEGLALPELQGEGIDIAIGILVTTETGREQARRWASKPEAHAAEAPAQFRDLLEMVAGYHRTLRMVRELRSPRPGRLPEGVDSDVLEDLRLARDCHAILTEGGHATEIWEVFCLVSTERGWVRAQHQEIARARDAGDMAGLADEALAIYERLLKYRGDRATFVEDLKGYLLSLFSDDVDPELMDVALGFIVVSEKGRERARLWLRNPEVYGAEALNRFRDLMKTTQAYLRTLEP